ncbi:ATP-binding protein [Actinomadura sp. NBRC 104425]|uniref:ATP-binding protein n=1 Tax=Actinomadura sp. NBRC 104425 TaxID=3032204 RepID=UPI0025547916|nr:ATP-binding protein [Actinomadura sp. NBRC 104425]
MEQPLLVAALAGAAIGIVVLAVVLVRERHVSDRYRGRVESLLDELRRRDEELRHLAGTRLPELRDQLDGRPVTVSRPLHEQWLTGTPFGQDVQTVLDLFTESVERARVRADRAAKVTLRAMMRTVQSLTNEQQLALTDMQERHDDPEVLADLLRLDHMNAQLGRRAQATAVLCGSWPGQQRQASALSDVVRGAVSRIRDYLRIQLNSEVNVAVVSRAVEPVVLVLAELLDNAARHSQPNTMVEVNFQMAHNGVAIMIDDAGVAMNGEEIQRATRLLNGMESVDINRIGDPPQVGFAVAGVLSARYGFTVSVDTRSPYGGVRAVVFLPNTLLTAVPTNEQEGPAVSPEPDASSDEAQPAQVGAGEQAEPVAVESTPGGLPKRRRLIAAPPAPAAEEPAAGGGAGAEPPSRRSAAGLGAWQRGTRSGRAASVSDGTERAAGQHEADSEGNIRS